MLRKIWIIFFILFIVGCQHDQESRSNKNDEQSPLQVGYSTYEQQNERGNAILLEDDHDGPVKEFMDQTMGGDNGGEKEGRFSRKDRNYHGHLNGNDGGARSIYFNKYEGRLIKEVNEAAEQVKEVKEARAATNGDKIIVAILLHDKNKEPNDVKEKVKKAIQPLVKGKKIFVQTDNSTFARVRAIDNELREGGPKKYLIEDLKNLFNTLEQ